MKIIRFELYYVLLMVPMFFMLALFDMGLRNNETSRIQYDNALDHAVEDGIAHMVEYDSTDTVIMNKDAAVENFYRSAKAALGVMGSDVAQEWLEIYTPVILVTDTDGFYIRHCYEVPAADGGVLTLAGWSPKYSYAYQGGQYVLSLTVSDVVQILDSTSNSLMEGDYHDLLRMMPQLALAFPFMTSTEQFETVRQQCISDSIEEQMEYYINEHNRIANDYGIKYHFFLPTITDEDWERAITGVSMMVIFQGYPYPSGRGYFNMATVSGARLAKSSGYFITTVNGRQVYHRDGCHLITSDARLTPYDDVKSAAKTGAYPCNLCNP